MRLALMLALLAFPVAAQAGRACDGAGVITRIDGRPQEIIIQRRVEGQLAAVPRPRVLEVVCAGDVVQAAGVSSVTLAIDGRGTVKVAAASTFTVPGRSGSPSLAGNAYRAINDEVLPDMKRLPWNTRLKGEGEDFGFALPGVSAGAETLTAGRRSLFVRLAGGVGPFRVELRDAGGAVLAAASDARHAITLPPATLKPGVYGLSVSDSSDRTLSASVTVAERAPPLDADFAGMDDPEVRAAASATALARADPATWALEAEQILNEAPATAGLDRDRVYELLESYSAD